MKKNRNKWVARITINKTQIHIGHFNTEKGAARAYNKKAIEILGELAKLNNISDDEE